jgi:hypothetical protein
MDVAAIDGDYSTGGVDTLECRTKASRPKGDLFWEIAESTGGFGINARIQ